MKRGDGPVSVPVGQRAAELLRQAFDGREDGPALHIAGRPICRDRASRTARAAGVDSIHAFRHGGKLHRVAPSPK